MNSGFFTDFKLYSYACVTIISGKINKMIINKNGMKQIEKDSGQRDYILMQKVGQKLAEQILIDYPQCKNLLILAGNGNNGGDGAILATALKSIHTEFILLCGEPNTDAAMQAYTAIPKKNCFTKKDLDSCIMRCDLIVDAIFGFSYHGELSSDIRPLFRKINECGKPVVSIDLNSGSECDTGYVDSDAIRSDITYAIQYKKPFHMLRKEHQLFKKCICLDIGLTKHSTTPYNEMNEELFFQYFPHKEENSYKGTYGKTLFVGGSYGTAGAASLNIIGARTVGSSYIHMAIPECIYPIVASQHITPVFHPFHKDNYREILSPIIQQATAIGFGSGASQMERKRDVMDLILQNAKCPVVLDAEGLRLLEHNTYLLRFVTEPVILTPHIGEFAGLLNLPIEVVNDRKIELAMQFAKKHHVYVVLKGPHTIVTSPSGDCYINQSGNQALAQAGSGDLLTGILTGILSMTKDVYQAICMSVWLHGYIAEYGTQEQSIQNFSLESYPTIMDKIFHHHNL